MAAKAEQKLDQVGGSVSGGRISDPQHSCVLTRGHLRAHAEIHQKQLILCRNPEIVTQTLARKALGGGSPAVRHAS